jgi:hypothetical protein
MGLLLSLPTPRDPKILRFRPALSLLVANNEKLMVAKNQKLTPLD